MAKAKKTDETEAVAEVSPKEHTDATTQQVEQPDTTATPETQSETEKKTKATAKAGKRSAKGIKEAEVKTAKEERKKHLTAAEAPAEKPKHAQKPARSRLERAGKKFREAAKLIDKTKEYSLGEGLELAAKTSTVKFDATVELHVNLNVDPRQADQNVRDNLVLPAGTGKTAQVAVFAEADDAAKAKNAGADIVGIDEITKKLEKAVVDFDTLIATPATMAKLGKYARFLGPKGLMPNPKSGTVTTDVVRAVKEAKAGRVEYRVDSTGIVHLGIGKVSFGKDKLTQNAQAILASIKAAKPASVKGAYIQAIHVTTSMGPSIKIVTSQAN